MVIGDRLKTLREAKNLSQGDIEKRTGLLRCYGDKPPALPKSAKLSTEDSLESSRSGALLMKKLVHVPNPDCGWNGARTGAQAEKIKAALKPMSACG